MSVELIDGIVRRIINKIREDKSGIVETVINGDTPGEAYHTWTGYLRGLQHAEEIAKKVARDMLKEDEDDYED